MDGHGHGVQHVVPRASRRVAGRQAGTNATQRRDRRASSSRAEMMRVEEGRRSKRSSSQHDALLEGLARSVVVGPMGRGGARSVGAGDSSIRQTSVSQSVSYERDRFCGDWRDSKGD